MRREGDRRLITEVLLETRGRTEMRLLEPGASPAGLLDLLQRHAVPGDLVTLVHVGDTWTASTLTREWPFDEAMAANLLADRSPTVVSGPSPASSSSGRPGTWRSSAGPAAAASASRTGSSA